MSLSKFVTHMGGTLHILYKFWLKFTISLSTLKLLPNQYYWKQHCALVFWLTMKICYLLHRISSRSIGFSQPCWLDSGFILLWSWVKTYLILIRGMWGFQLEKIQRHRCVKMLPHAVYHLHSYKLQKNFKFENLWSFTHHTLSENIFWQ